MTRKSGRATAPLGLRPAQRLGQLFLGHLRAALDVAALRFVVQLVACAALGLVRPAWARFLLTVRAPISFARFVLAPRSFAESLTCSYCRSCLSVHSFGMTHLLSARPYTRARPGRSDAGRPRVAGRGTRGPRQYARKFRGSPCRLPIDRLLGEREMVVAHRGDDGAEHPVGGGEIGGRQLGQRRAGLPAQRAEEFAGHRHTVVGVVQ